MNYITLVHTDYYVHPDADATSTHGAMTVGELREALEDYNDDTVVLIDNWTPYGLESITEPETEN